MRTLISVKVSGSTRYPEDAVLAASGLQLGKPITDDDLKEAARHLGEIGVFGDINYSYSYSSAGTKVVLQLTDAEKMVPVRFEDFVWFSERAFTDRIGPLLIPGAGHFLQWERADIFNPLLVSVFGDLR